MGVLFPIVQICHEEQRDDRVWGAPSACHSERSLIHRNGAPPQVRHCPRCFTGAGTTAWEVELYAHFTDEESKPQQGKALPKTSLQEGAGVTAGLGALHLPSLLFPCAFQPTLHSDCAVWG